MEQQQETIQQKFRSLVISIRVGPELREEIEAQQIENVSEHVKGLLIADLQRGIQEMPFKCSVCGLRYPDVDCKSFCEDAHKTETDN